MVQLLLNFRKRNNLDVNNMNFVTDPFPIGVQPNGLPAFREITDASLVQTPWSTAEYQDVATNDHYGFYETFYIRSGTRKIQQRSIAMTVEQKGNDYMSPLFIVGFFGFRPVQYTGTEDSVPTPLYDYFFLSQHVNMLGNNVRSELKTSLAGSVTDVLETANMVPPSPISNVGPPITDYRKWVAHDTAFLTAWDHVATANTANKIYTTHKMSTPIFNHIIENTAYPPNVHLEAKVVIYCFRQEHPTSATNSDIPILSPIPADDVSAFGGYVDVI